MSQMSQKISAPSAAAEPQAGSASMPVWLVVAVLVIFFFAGVYFDANGGWFNQQVYAPYRSVEEVQLFQPVGDDGGMALGKRVYEQVCALCHGVDGMGKPGQAPPFAGSEWVTTDSIGRLARIPLGGLSGPIKVKGETWTLAMPAMGAALPDDQLAAVLTYMRNSWGNQASKVTADQVKAVRAETAGHTQPWTADELMKVK
jgi:mono/diheme cytochrome c family protein